MSVRPLEPVKLHPQPIQIPTFSGTYKTWPAFNGTFTSLIINNQSFSDVERMQYLKMNVNGEAGKLIAQLDRVEGNFEEAWKLLCHRFNNKRAILNAQFDIIFNLRTVGSSVAKDLRNILIFVLSSIFYTGKIEMDPEKWRRTKAHFKTIHVDSYIYQSFIQQSFLLE